MLGFVGLLKRPVKSNKRRNLAPCSRVLHPDAVTTLAVSHTRIPYTNISGRAISNLEVFYANWSYNAAIEWTPTSTLTVRAAVEYPVGTMTPLYDKDGNRDISVIGGQTGLSLRAFGLNIPSGAVYYIRTRCLAAGGDSAIPRAYTHNIPYEGGTIQAYTSTTNDGNDYTLSGNQPTATGKAYGPYAVCSSETGNKARSFAILGDSIFRGNIVGISPAEVAISGAGYGYLNFCFSGTKLQSNINMTNRRALMRAAGITDIVMNFPVNDLTNSRTVAQMQGDFNTLWANLKSDGVQKIIQATCLPKTTDATSPGTVDPNPAGAFTGGATSFRSQINAWFRSVVGQTNKPDAIFEMADVLETSRDSGLWINPTTNTADGLHPSSAGATTIADALKTFLQTIGF